MKVYRCFNVVLGLSAVSKRELDSKEAINSKRMSRIRSKDTKPELFVRKLIHSLGYRYRLHGKNLPGSPDIVFPSKKKVIFVHGCFWHQHSNCKLSKLPKTRREYWHPKLKRNKMRDYEVQASLVEIGWEYLVVWECQIDDIQNLTEKIIKFLSASSSDGRK